MTKYIDAEKLKEILLPSYEEAKKESLSATDTVKWEKVEYIFDFVFHFIDSLQQEQGKSKKDCNDCPHCVDRKDQYGWHFKGCFGGPYKGKFIAEIDECPLKQEQPEVDLDEEIASICKAYGITEHLDAELGPLDIRNIANYFYVLGKNAKK